MKFKIGMRVLYTYKDNAGRPTGATGKIGIIRKIDGDLIFLDFGKDLIVWPHLESSHKAGGPNNLWATSKTQVDFISIEPDNDGNYW